jgi:hypothetical protein
VLDSICQDNRNVGKGHQVFVHGAWALKRSLFVLPIFTGIPSLALAAFD